MTQYWHLGAVASGINGNAVSAGQYLGTTGINCGNPTTFSHIHFGLFYNGQPYPLDGVSIGGYTIHAGVGQYNGSWTRNSDGVTVHTTTNGNASCCLTNDQPTGGGIGEGSFVRTPDGRIYRIVGGAAVHIDSCEPLGGCPGVVAVSNVDGYPSEPRNGTFVRKANGAGAGLIARAAGGHLIGLGSCEPLGGCGGYVNVDAAGFEAYQAAHPTPLDGTLVEGLPSASYWTFSRGQRSPAAANPGAVPIDDRGLAAFPIADKTAPQTTITKHPKPKITIKGRSFQGSFSFKSNEPRSSFKCKLDKAPFQGCISPKAYKLGAGKHTFQVLATDRAGNSDKSPATFVVAVSQQK